LVGGRWTLLIVRNLLLGPQRYGELQLGLPGITTNMLADRLKQMQAEGLVDKAGGRWGLTELGRGLEPAVLALGGFGQRYLAGGPQAEDRVDVRWGMVSLKRRYTGQGSGSARVLIAERTFRVRWEPAGVEVLEQDLPAPLTLSGDLLPWLFQGGTRATVESAGHGLDDFAAAFGLR
jgi:DNA-binding HxlR family transcriptional regulator